MPALADPSRIYNPTVQKGGLYYQLPRPIDSMDEEYRFRVSGIDIPLVEGQLITTNVLGALLLTFTSTIVGDTPAEVLSIKDEIRSFFLDSVGTTFNFYRHRDTDNEYYRWYPNCTISALRFSHKPDTVLYQPYSFSFIVPGGREKVSGTYPGGDTGNDATEDEVYTLNGPLLIDLADNAGASAVIIRNSDFDIVARITSLGDIEYVGDFIQCTTIVDS